METANNGKRTRRGVNSLPTAAEKEHLQMRLKTAKNNKSLGNNIRVPTLMWFCDEHGISVRDSANKYVTKGTLLGLVAQWVGRNQLVLPIIVDQ